MVTYMTAHSQTQPNPPDGINIRAGCPQRSKGGGGHTQRNGALKRCRGDLSIRQTHHDSITRLIVVENNTTGYWYQVYISYQPGKKARPKG